MSRCEYSYYVTLQPILLGYSLQGAHSFHGVGAGLTSEPPLVRTQRKPSWYFVHTELQGRRFSPKLGRVHALPHTPTHNSFGDRSFGAVGPQICNSLLRGLWTSDISYK